MKSAYHLVRTALCVAALPVCAAPAFPADRAVGVARSSGSFHIDSAVVWNSSTVFDNSTVETASTPCTIRLNGGGKVEVGVNSSIRLVESGLVLERGEIRLDGPADMGLNDAPIHFRSLAQPSMIKALILKGTLSMEVSKGSAEGLGGNERYAVLTTGTRMEFPRDDKQAAGVDLLIRGCLHKEKDRWYINGTHVEHKVELSGEIPRQSGRPLEVLGILLPMTASDTSIAARIQVLSSHSVEGECAGPIPLFMPIVVGGAVAGGTAAAVIPGQESNRVSVP